MSEFIEQQKKGLQSKENYKKKWYWFAYPPIYEDTKFWRTFRVIGWVLTIASVGLAPITFVLYFGIIQRVIIYIQTGIWYRQKDYFQRLTSERIESKKSPLNES